MKMIDDVIIIGIDSGYGNIKTANCCFPASVSAIIYRYRNGKLDISAEVTDYCGHSISIISPERAKIVESEVNKYGN